MNEIFRCFGFFGISPSIPDPYEEKTEVIHCQDGIVFEGVVRNREPLRGTLTFSDGAYTGTFEKGEFHGQGVFTYVNGIVYKGGYLKGKRHGFGVLKYANGDEYCGEFVQDLPQGKGVYKTWNGDKFEGENSNKVPVGKGVKTFSDGIIERGTWEKGLLIDGECFYQLNDSDRLVVEIRNRKLFSVQSSSSIHTQNGEWKSDVYFLKSTHSRGGLGQIPLSQRSCVVNLSSDEVAVLEKTMQRCAKVFSDMAPGTILRRHKETPEVNPRTIVAYKALDEISYAFIMCKRKMADPKNPGVVIKAEKPLGKGGSKVAKIAYEWFSGVPFVNLTLIIDPLKSGMADFKREVQFCQLFAGRRGFSDTAPIAIHYYAKKKSDGTIVLKVGYFVRYYAGGDLYQCCYSSKRGKFNAAVLKTCFMDFASVLKSLEEEKIVHGDVSLSNFLVDLETNKKFKGIILHDFGFSRSFEQTSGLRLGTYRYIPPEQIYWNHTDKRDLCDAYPQGCDVWGTALCFLVLAARGHPELHLSLENFLKVQALYCVDTTRKNETFEECCAHISQRLNIVLDLFEKEKVATEELSIIREMLQVDPAKRWTGLQVYGAVEKSPKLSDPL